MDKDLYRNVIINIKKELYSYGISVIELLGLPLQYWEDIRSACAIVYNEFPEMFKMLHSIRFEKMDEDTFAYVNIYDYEEFKITQQPLYIRINEACKSSEQAEERFEKGNFEGAHNIKTFKGYFLHELVHVLELSILAKSNFKQGMSQDTYADYHTKASMYDISKQIYNIVLNTNTLNESPLEDKRYGNKSYSEFLAETMAEFWECDQVDEYVIDVYHEVCLQYKLYYK